MRNRLSLILLVLFAIHFTSICQTTVPNNIRVPGAFLGWNGTGPNSGPLDIRNDFNQQILFGTNGFYRMLIDNGGGLQNGGRIAIGNNLPAGFNPQARIHIHQQTAVTASNTPFIRFTTQSTNTTATDGFAIGNTTQSTAGNTGEAHLLQFEQEPLIMSAPNSNTWSPNLLPYEWFRIENGKTFLAAPTSPIRTTDGYIGLNKPSPRSHIEMNTPHFQGGEEFFLAKPDDIFDPPASTIPALNVQMGFMNLTSLDNQLLPGVFGNINQQNQWGTALAMVGCIPNAQDIVGNPPVMKFAVGKNWILNGNTPFPVGTFPVTATVVARPIFSWENGASMMYMAANGRLRIGHNLTLTNPTQVAQRPNNRIEITAATFDPYFDPTGNPIGNPNFGMTNFGSASGLRFTFLTSRDLVITPNATNQIDPSKVLSVDVNGDVVAIYPALGAPCSNTAQIAAQTFTSSRAVNQGTFNMEWRGQGRNGFGTSGCTVGNRVEITGLTSFSATPGGNSGLRFTNVTSTSTAITNPTNKVLSVNANGDVILVTDQTGTVVGSGSVTAQNGLNMITSSTVELGGTLLHNTSIDFNGSALTYSNSSTATPFIHHVVGPNGGTYSKAIGAHGLFGTPETSYYEEAILTNNSWNYGRQLFVVPAASSISPVFTGLVGTYANVNTTGFTITGDVFGNWTKSTNPTGTGGNIAGKFEASGGTSMTKNNIGVMSSAGGANNNYGVYTEISNPPQANEDNGVRVFSQSNLNTTTNVGGYFKALQGVNTYGIYAEASGGTTTNYAGYFNGQTYFNGNINGVGSFLYSDLALKTNIDTITNAQGIIKQLKPKTFYYDTTNVSGIKFSSKKQYGLIAQDVESILPELVGSTIKPAERDSLGNVTIPSATYKNLNYDAFIAILIKGMQQQQRTIEKQDSVINVVQSQIAALTSSVTSCCSSSAVRSTSTEEQNRLAVTLSDKDMIVLNQNSPNPFAEQTTITYNVPEKYGYAQMIFSTIDGRILKTVDITKKGRGTLSVFSSDLSSGMYTYSLVVDGKIIDTKKMVKSE